MGYVTDGHAGQFTNLKHPEIVTPELPPLMIRPANSRMTPPEEYARANELRAEANERGESMNFDQALRVTRTEPLSRLRRPFRR